MKKVLSLLTALTIAVTLHAQDKDVTKFLGIPVDGTKTEMIQKLKAKGFTSSSFDRDVLEGEFNGEKVFISVVTNNNKVYRIHVMDKNSRDETAIRIRFNSLCNQFQYNSKYVPAQFGKEQTIPEDENIGYGIRLHHKQYEAVFYQRLNKKIDLPEYPNIDEIPLPDAMKSVWFMISEKSYGKYCIAMY